MTDRITIKLPEGVEYEHPEVQRLLNEIEAVKPLPPKLTMREQLAATIREGSWRANAAGITPDPPWEKLDQRNRDQRLAEADAAIAFFRTVLVQVRNDNLQLIGDGDPAAVRVHNDAVEQLTIDLGKALSK